MSTPVKHSITIIQGTTQRVPLVRQYVEYAVKSTGCGKSFESERNCRHLPKEYQK